MPRSQRESAVKTSTQFSDLAGLDAALARDFRAQSRAQRATLSQRRTPTARFARALAAVGEALL